MTGIDSPRASLATSARCWCGEERREVEFQLICATNRDLKPLVRSGEFRQDLYYRINVVHIEVPPLRERHEDILWLADRFLEACNKTHPEASRVWGAAAPDEPGISRKNSWERTRRPGIGALPRILRVYPPDLHRITSATTVASTSASMAINAAV